MPNMEKSPRKHLITVAVVIFAHGNMKGNLEYSSITARKYRLLLLLVRGPLKSTFNRSKG